MPNWSTNTFTVSGDAGAIARLRAEYMTADGRLEFHKIIPYPEGFDPDLPSGTGEESYAFHLGATEVYSRPRSFYEEAFNTARTNALEWNAKRDRGEDVPAHLMYSEAYLKYETYAALGEAYAKNVDLTGHKNWYEFNCANWGTKWGACDSQVLTDQPDKLELRFCTAWCEPEPIFVRLHELFPTLHMKYVAEHEGDDSITGRQFYPHDPED